MIIINTQYRFLAILLFTLSLTSCEVETVSPAQPEIAATITNSTVTAFTIRKGQHNTNLNTFKRLSTSSIRFEATFDSSAVYTTVNPANQASINKLYGMSDCNSEHHTNSARFGWRWYKNRLEILAYTYDNKARKHEVIGEVKLGEAAVYELLLVDNQYVFRLNGKQVIMPRACTGKGEGYQLYPYFGGTETAPHDIKISIKELQ